MVPTAIGRGAEDGAAPALGSGRRAVVRCLSAPPCAELRELGPVRGRREPRYADWFGTLDDPKGAELWSLWWWHQPHGPVPAEHSIRYLVVGWDHAAPADWKRARIYLELADSRVRLPTIAGWFEHRVRWEPRRWPASLVASYCKMSGCWRERGTRRPGQGDIYRTAAALRLQALIARTQARSRVALTGGSAGSRHALA